MRLSVSALQWVYTGHTEGDYNLPMENSSRSAAVHLLDRPFSPLTRKFGIAYVNIFVTEIGHTSIIKKKCPTSIYF